MKSELRYRRLTWLISILRYPADNVQLRAAVFGEVMHNRESQQINQLVQLLAEDLQALADVLQIQFNANDILDNVGPCAFISYPIMHWLFDADCTQVRTYEDPRTQAVPSPHQDIYCDWIYADGAVCGAHCTSKDQYIWHNITKHSIP